MAKPKHVDFDSLFNKWRIVVGTILGIVIYFWAVFFFPDPVMTWISTHVETGAKKIGPVFPILGTSALAFIALFILGEPLLTGASRKALFYQGEFVSARISSKYAIEIGEAKDYWIAYYDCWQFDSEPEHIEYLHTTKIRFLCLFDFLARRLLIGLAIVSVALLIYEALLGQLEVVSFAGKGVFVVVMLLLLGLFALSNKLPKDGKVATGCWKAWSDQNATNFRAYVRALGEKSHQQFFEANQARHRALITASK